MSILSMMMIITLIMFMNMNHPLTMGMILIIQTLLISLSLGFILHSFWYSYMIFLIVIGGLMIIFIYMTSIASNEKFIFSPKIIMLMIPVITLMMLMMKENIEELINLKNNNLSMIMSNINFMINENISLNKMYNKSNFLITIMLMNFLLMTLIMSVKITNHKQGPMRQKF